MKFYVFKDMSRQWRWHLKASNGRIVATSGGDGYVRAVDCLEIVRRLNADRWDMFVRWSEEWEQQ